MSKIVSVAVSIVANQVTLSIFLRLIDIECIIEWCQ